MTLGTKPPFSSTILAHQMVDLATNAMNDIALAPPMGTILGHVLMQGLKPR